MTSDQIRQSFLEYFKKKDHTIVSSMSLIPRDDPSLLFTNAGMVQFKPLWTGSIPLPYRRAASTQKCLRTSDLDNVGKTKRHLTYFEMLGNFSFGDYFKEEAIEWAWEYLIDVLGIDKGKLSVSVFTDDDEAYDLWNKKIGLKTNRIFRLGEEHNFWGPAGNSGPCGPCSEIFYDLGEKFGCGKKDCAPGCECDRWPEIWNLVFPQFDQTVAGERKPLKNRGIDTGMGMERLTMVLQKKDTLFKTDLFFPIIEEICRIRNIDHGQNANKDIAINVIADHIRALVFAIGDGIIPSNEERGYVLRRILRRAVRLSRDLGQAETFLYKLAPLVVKMYKNAFPDLEERREEITLVIKSEEDRFITTLEKGLAQFEEISRKKQDITAEDAFKLYDTFGFPIELTNEIAEEKGLKVDEDGFLQMLDQAREISKTKAKFIPKGEWKIIKEGNGAFVGYDKNEIETEILRYNANENIIEIVLAESPFYAEAGGQVGDQGELIGKNYILKVLDTYWLQGMIVCHCEIVKGKFSPGSVIASVDMGIRKESARAHTSTHLLHAALRRVLGEHARQEGSFVEPGRFRFDFTHFKPLTEDEIIAIEDLVNEKILAAIPVKKFFTTLDEAKKLGAMAIFGEKYGREVRVVQIDDFSIELCGGIHIENTGEIGSFKIMSQEAAAAGIRRIDGLVSRKLFDHLRNNDGIIKELSRLVGSTNKDLVKWVNETQQQFRQIEKEYENALNELARTEAMVLLAKLYQEKNNFISQELKNYGPKGMRMVADMIREKAKDSVGFLYENVNNRISYLIFVGDNKVKTLPAVKLIKEISKILGGGGGGKPHLAEGGGGDPAKVKVAIEQLKKLIS